MTLKEAFKAAIELSPEDLLRLQDSISSVLEVGAAKPVGPVNPLPVKKAIRKPRKQKEPISTGRFQAPPLTQHAASQGDIVGQVYSRDKIQGGE